MLLANGNREGGCIISCHLILGISSLIIIVLVIPRPGLGMEAEWALFSPVAETLDTDSDW